MGNRPSESADKKSSEGSKRTSCMERDKKLPLGSQADENDLIVSSDSDDIITDSDNDDDATTSTPSETRQHLIHFSPPTPRLHPLLPVDKGGQVVSSCSNDGITEMVNLPSEIEEPPTPEYTLGHKCFTLAQNVELCAQILVFGALAQGKPPGHDIMVRAFGQPGGCNHAWEEVLRAAVDRLQYQKSPMSGLETPTSSPVSESSSSFWIGSCTPEQGSNDVAVSKTMFAEPQNSKTCPNSLQHDGVEEDSGQDLDCGSAMIQQVKKYPGHDELTLQAASVLPSVSCNGAIQGDQSEINHLENTAEHTEMFEQQKNDYAHVGINFADKVNQVLLYYGGEELGQDLGYDSAKVLQVKKDPGHGEPTLQTAGVLSSVNRNGASQGVKSETNHPSENTKMFEEQNEDEARLEVSVDRVNQALQHEDDEELTKDVDYGSARIQPSKKDPSYDETTLQNSPVLPVVSCNGAIQGDGSETNHRPGNTTEYTTMFEQQSADKTYLQVSCADKVNPAIYDDCQILKKHTICGGQIPESHCGNMDIHDKSSETNSLFEMNTEKDIVNIQKSCCSRPVSSPTQDGKEGADRTSSKKMAGNTVVETSHVNCSDDCFSSSAAACVMSANDNMFFRTQDKDTVSTTEILTEQDLCVKCGKDGQLLKCSRCVLAAHGSCFGPSVTFDDSGRFCCPVCFYNQAFETYQKAKETCFEARKNLSSFLGTKHAKQHVQSARKQRRSAYREDHLTRFNTTKRQENHQPEGDTLSHQYPEPGQQKTNAMSDACPEEAVTEKVSFGLNSDVSPMNRYSVLQNIRNQVRPAQHEQPVQNVEACGETGDCNSCHEVQYSSQNRLSQAVRTNPRKALGRLDQNVPLPSRRSYACPRGLSFDPLAPTGRPLAATTRRSLPTTGRVFAPTRRSLPSTGRPLAPTGRRSRLLWTDEEEEALREAVQKFTPKDNRSISWVQIREYGWDKFHETRTSDDLRNKWSYMKKKNQSHENCSTDGECL